MCTNNENSISEKRKLTLAEKLQLQLTARNRAAEQLLEATKKFVLSATGKDEMYFRKPKELKENIFKELIASKKYTIMSQIDDLYILCLPIEYKHAAEKIKSISDHINKTFEKMIGVGDEISFSLTLKNDVTDLERILITSYIMKLGFDKFVITHGVIKFWIENK